MTDAEKIKMIKEFVDALQAKSNTALGVELDDLVYFAEDVDMVVYEKKIQLVFND